MQNHQLIFEGLSPNSCKDTVAQQLKRTFKLSAQQVQKLLLSPGTPVKRNISKPKARELKLALAKLSVLTRIEVSPVDPSRPTTTTRTGLVPNPTLSLAPQAGHPTTGEPQKIDGDCPNCQQSLNVSEQQRDSCRHCGVVFTKFYKRLELNQLETQQEPLDSELHPSGRRYGVAAAEQAHNHQASTTKPSFGVSGALILVLAGLLVLGLQYLGERNLQQRLSMPGIQLLAIDDVDSLDQLPMKGHITIVDFYSQKCGVCRRRSHNLELLAAKNADLVIRRFNVTESKDFQQASRRYHLSSLVRHARIYDEEGKLRLIDKGKDQYYASQFISRWSLLDERPAFTL